MVPLKNRLMAEFVGTLWLVLGGVGGIVIGVPMGIDLLGVGLCFGLAVLTMAYAIGHVSGCHLNPAVTIGLATSKRFPWSDVAPYIVAQVVAAIVGAAIVYSIAKGRPDFQIGDFGSNGYGEHSPGKYSLLAGLITEIVMTFIFLMIILGATDKRAPAGFAPIAVGLGLALIIWVGGPVTNLSVNPARSTGPAVFVGGWALAQLWMFWIAPIIGGALAGVVYPIVTNEGAGASNRPRA